MDLLKKYGKQLKMITPLLTIAAAAMLLIGHGCSKLSLSKDVGSNEDLFGMCKGDSLPEYQVIPGASSVSTVWANQALDQFIACTGLSPANQGSAREEYEKRRSTLSAEGDPTKITGPMMMGLAAIAGEVCSGLQAENSPLFQSNINDTISVFALSCWARPETQVEKDAINQTLLALGGSQKQINLTLCTAMLSSLAGIKQ